MDEVLPAPKLAVYGFQHVLAFYAGAVIVPILLASAINLTPEQLAYLINADLFTCGIASIIQSVGFWKIGVRMPLLQGVTFAAVSPMISIGLAEGGGVPGLRAIYGSVIVAGIVAFLVAPFFARLIRLFPPIVTGTVITIIGVVLLSVAALDAGGGGASQFTDPPTFGALRNLALAGFTLLIILVIYRMFTGFVATVAVLIGLVVGTLVGWLFDFTDFSRVAGADVLGVTTPFYFGTPTFNVAAVISMVIVMLITMVETTGDVFACGEIVEKPVDKEDVARALRADGLATTLGGILNSFPYTCFAENVGLVRLTKVKSRWVVATAGLFMILIGLVPKVGAIVAAIPPPVLGGAGIALFGTVAVIGIQTLRRVDFHDERNVIILAVSLGFAMAPTVYPTITSFFPEAVRTIISSGITLGSISAILLNLVFNVWGGHSNLVTKVLPVPRHDEVMSIDQVNQMDREQFVDTFGGLFQGAALDRRAGLRRPALRGRVRPAQGLPRRPVRGPGGAAAGAHPAVPGPGRGGHPRGPAVQPVVDGPGVRRPEPARQRRVHHLRRAHPGLQGEVRLPAGRGRAREHQGDDPQVGQRPAAELPRRRAGDRAGRDRQDRQPAPARHRRGAGRPAGRVTPG